MSFHRAVVLALALAVPEFSLGQELQDDPILDVQEGLRSILKMKWDGDQLVIDRAHWDQWAKRPAADDDRLPPGFPRGSVREERDKPGVIQFFSDYLESARRRGGGHRHPQRIRDGDSPGGRIVWSNVGLDGMIQIFRGDFMLRIEELQPPHRLFSVYESSGGRLRISIVGKTTLHIQQQEDGTASIIQIDEDRASYWKGESLADLTQKHKEGMKQITERLMPMGFVLPKGS